ncbi:MAG: hypothetical protein AAGB32_03295 [Pseudomonadota bacterium]
MMKTIGKAKDSAKNQRGNAMIYILVALALFGFLTLALTRQNLRSDNQNLSRERIDLYSNELIEYVGSAQQVIDMMIMSGSDANDLDFMLPTNVGFNTAPHIHKVFHPSGGGLNYLPEPSSNILEPISADAGWQYQDQINVEWTPLDNLGNPTNDVLIIAHEIKRPICEYINEQITGSTTIPVLTGTIATHFVPGGGNNDFTTTECAACEGYSSLCVANNAQTAYSYYTILEAR